MLYRGSSSALDLYESDANYRALFENNGMATALVDERLTILLVNHAFESLSGYRKDHLENRVNWMQLVLAADCTDMHKHCVSCSSMPISTNSHCIFRLIRMDGQIRDAFMTFSTMPQSGKNIISILDVTENVRDKDELRNREERYRSMLEEMDEAYVELDQAGNITYVNEAACSQSGYTKEELIGMNYRRYTPEDKIEQYIAIFSGVMSSGKPVYRQPVENIRKDGSRAYLESSMFALRDEKGEINGLHGVSRDVTAHKESEKRLEKSFEALRKTLDGSVQAMAKIVEMRDPYTSGHQVRVAELATAMAWDMKLPDDTITCIRTAAILHDIGKMYVPSSILSKPGKLTEAEFNIIKMHAQGSCDILSSIDFPWPIATIVAQHHERMDGSGYPKGLTAAEILPEAKILAVADVVEAMSSHRPYRPALGVRKAVAHIIQKRGQLYDEDAVDSCLRLYRKRALKFK
jgi:PAS domain S-box-containing protein/putative nucleotidyltransferase with HDIG domain